MIGHRKSNRLVAGLSLLWIVVLAGAGDDPTPAAKLAAEYGSEVRPILERYCLTCHSAEAKKGDLDLDRFTTLGAVRKDVKPWQGMVEQLETGEMPPKKKPQPTADERRRLIAWVRGFLDSEALSRAGDPGQVGLRRLSNAEYDATVRDVTGVDLRPAREFPADGAAGEGFTNASEALGMSPTLLAKYLKASKEIASHAILLPDGIRFSPSNTRRDWTDESVAQMRRFYAGYTTDLDGHWTPQPYLWALVRHRDDLAAGKVTPAAVAASEKLSPKYLAKLHEALSAGDPHGPMGRLRSLLGRASAEDAGTLGAEVAAWQGPLWTFQNIGSYRYGNVVRPVANEPALVDLKVTRTALKPAPGQGEVVLYLVARDLSAAGGPGHAVWDRPRFEGNGQPLLLRDYAEFGPRYEMDYAAIFAETPRYLAATIEAAHDRNLSADDLARKHELDPAWLARWIDLAALRPVVEEGGVEKEPGKLTPAVPLALLDGRVTAGPKVLGWTTPGTGLPSLLANSSDEAARIPGLIPPHRVAVHPTPTEFAAAAWKSPIAGRVRVTARIAHAHPACGNGVAWWVEVRKGDQARILAEGTLELGKETTVPPRDLSVTPGDLVILAVDARDGSHSCDLTEIALTVGEAGKPGGRTWDLAGDVAGNLGDGNPHADGFGNAAVWSFVKGPTRPVYGESGPPVPADSVLGRWREAASDPGRQVESAELAGRLGALLGGARPLDEKHPDRKLYDTLAALDGPLFRGLEPSRLGKPRPRPGRYGLDEARFGTRPGGKAVDGDDLVVPLDQVVEVRLPAALFRDREFVAEGTLDADSGGGVVQFSVSTAPPVSGARWDGKSPLVAAPAARGPLLVGLAEFRRLFPPLLCYPNVIPLDEVVCLKTFHREDGPLIDLFLDDEQARQIDRLWAEHRFISKFPVVENEYLPLFIGFVTQDQPKELLAYFESQREPFRRRAEAFQEDFEAAAPAQFRTLSDFAALAYRRPLSGGERQGLLDLYRTLREEGRSHEDAFRGVLERVLVSPAFLYHLEEPPPGQGPRPVNDWEIAARLSYFLWSSTPDEPLRRLAAEGRLHEPAVLAAQSRRMMKDDRVRALAIEFGTQWIHVRGFDGLKEKNEALFPSFDDTLRKAMSEESIMVFLALMRDERPVAEILDSDATYLDETLARHYGIPGVSGPEWRRVAGVKAHGRGGILGFASVLTKQAGASRTSPVLRGNWVVETLLGEKLPRPPVGVPQLPEGETGNDGLTMRQLVEKHVSAVECAACHQRIDPFGFSLEKYDPIGRLREKDLGGLPVDAKSRLREGTEFDGIDGLRNYLLTRKRDVFTRLFCRKLLGYALGREVTLTDQPLIDAMIAGMDRHDGRVSSLVEAIVGSTQFRSIRGRGFVEGD